MIDENETICYCAGITRKVIINAIVAGAETLSDIQQHTGAGIGGDCKKKSPKGRCCHPDIVDILNQQRAVIQRS